MKQLARWAVALTLALAPLPTSSEEITVTFYGTLMYGAPFAVAKEKGFLAEEGLQITDFVTSKGGGTTVRNILASEVPYGEASLAAVIAAAAENIPFTIVNAGVQSVGDVTWVTRKDSPLANVADLRGKPVGYTSPKSVSEMLLVMALDRSGVKWSEITPKALGGAGAGLTALQQKGVEAAPIVEPVWTQFADKYKPLFKAADLLPPITQTVGVVRTDYLKSNPEKIGKIIRARRRGVDFIYANQGCSTLIKLLCMTG